MKDYKNEYPLNTFSGETKKELEKLLDKAIRETAEAVCDKMIGEGYVLRFYEEKYLPFYKGYNNRIKEEKEIKKQIIESL